MVSVSTVSNLKIAVALAERQVQRDQSQVQEDSARLSQSQDQLDKDTRQLGSVQEQSQRAAQGAARVVQPTFDRAIQTQAAKPPAAPVSAAVPTVTAPPAPTAPVVASKSQLNAQGQTIGKLINVTA